jgi:hypothetical protein
MRRDCRIVEGHVEVQSNAPERVDWVRAGLEQLVLQDNNTNLSWDGCWLRFEGRPWRELLQLESAGTPLYGLLTGEIRISGDDGKVAVDYHLTYRNPWELVWRSIPSVLLGMITGMGVEATWTSKRGTHSSREWFFRRAMMCSITAGAERQIHALQNSR